MTTRDLIKSAVAASGMNAREISEATGGSVSLQTVWRYLNERGDISTELLDHIMRALNLEWPKPRKGK